MLEEEDTAADDDEDETEATPEVEVEETKGSGVDGVVEGWSVTDGTSLTDVIEGATGEYTSLEVELVIVDDSGVEVVLGVLILGIDEGIVTSELAHWEDNEDSVDDDKDSTVEGSVVDGSAVDESGVEVVDVSWIDELSDGERGVYTELAAADSVDWVEGAGGFDMEDGVYVELVKALSVDWEMADGVDTEDGEYIELTKALSVDWETGAEGVNDSDDEVYVELTAGISVVWVVADEEADIGVDWVETADGVYVELASGISVDWEMGTGTLDTKEGSTKLEVDGIGDGDEFEDSVVIDTLVSDDGTRMDEVDGVRGVSEEDSGVKEEVQTYSLEEDVEDGCEENDELEDGMYDEAPSWAVDVTDAVETGVEIDSGAAENVETDSKDEDEGVQMYWVDSDDTEEESADDCEISEDETTETGWELDDTDGDQTNCEEVVDACSGMAEDEETAAGSELESEKEDGHAVWVEAYDDTAADTADEDIDEGSLENKDVAEGVANEERDDADE